MEKETTIVSREIEDVIDVGDDDIEKPKKEIKLTISSDDAEEVNFAVDSFNLKARDSLTTVITTVMSVSPDFMAHTSALYDGVRSQQDYRISISIGDVQLFSFKCRLKNVSVQMHDMIAVTLVFFA